MIRIIIDIEERGDKLATKEAVAYALEQFGKGGFTGTGTADDTDGLTGFDIYGKSFDHGGEIRAVLEGDIFE